MGSLSLSKGPRFFEIMKKLNFLFLILISLFITSCFQEKDTPFYDSEWVMQNYDADGLLYYHHLILSPGHQVMLRASYADSTSIIVWTGTYKINSKKIKINFTECVRYEDGKPVGTYDATKLIKFYTGEFYYSVGLIGEEDAEDSEKVYHLELIRPRNYFYGEATDIFGNRFEEFIKFNR